MDSSLSERQKTEEEYHDNIYKDDADAEIERLDGEFYKYFYESVGDISGMKVLDFGCGGGWVSINLARKGATVWGFDISIELIKKARKLVDREKLSDKITLEKMAAESIEYNSNFFDLIVGSAILHHTELEITLKNIKRVLKPGCRALFVEPMNQNIFLKIWRKLTPWRRSSTEKALTIEDIHMIKELFPNAELTSFGLFSIFTAGLLLLNKNIKFLVGIHQCLEKLDRQVFKLLPFLNRYCAVVVLELRK